MARFQYLKYFSVIGILVGLASHSALASTPPPATVSNLLANIDRAANSKQLAGLNNSFAPNYTVDGLSRAAWEKGVKNFWQRYTNLRYQTVIQSWKPEGNGFSVETMTNITASQSKSDQTSKLTAQLLSRQKISGGKIVQQQILSEQTMTTSGHKPPTVEFNIPAQLKTNEIYNIDAIVNEPLGDDVMMGTVVEQAVNAEGYSKPITYSLDLLATGGLFKKAKAPSKAGDYWLSATLVRPGGMTTTTRRVHVLRK
jgi:hypothetical protein